MSEPSSSFTIVVPVYNDWQSLKRLLTELQIAWQESNKADQVRLRVVAVDDAPQSSLSGDLPVLGALGIELFYLRLKRNLGHQRAIAVGLAWSLQAHAPDFLGVMDADGEDNPSDMPRLLDACLTSSVPKVVFAERKQRGESLTFRAGYLVYRWMHLALTGHRIRFGNFSVIPAELVRIVLMSSDVWSHYAAAVVKLKLPCHLVPTKRAKRYFGRSTMSFATLISHGLTAIGLFYEVVSVRLMAVFALSSALGLVLAVWSALHEVDAVSLLLAINFFWLAGMVLVTFQSIILLQSKTRAEVMPATDALTFVEVNFPNAFFSKDDHGSN